MTNREMYCEALELALDFEKKGEEFYRDSIQKVEDEFAKRTLNLLAHEELHHIQKINQLNEALVGNSEDFDFDAFCQTELPQRIEAHLKKFTGKEEQKIGPRSNDIEIYDLAMDMEKESYDMYKDSYETLGIPARANDERTKKFFEFLLKEESLHYDLLAESKKYLQEPSYYFEDYGGWIFGGV